MEAKLEAIDPALRELSLQIHGTTGPLFMHIYMLSHVRILRSP